MSLRPGVGFVATALLVLPLLTNAQTLRDPRLIAEPVVTGFDLPDQIAFLADDDFLLIEQRTGKVFRVTGGSPVEVLDVAVNGVNERGLLGIAVHPQFASNGFVYLFYSESSTGVDTTVLDEILGNRIYRYTYDGSNLIDPLLIKELPALGSGHNGGILAYGPDDKLYAVIGDKQGSGVLQNIPGGQPDDTGVIFRMEDDGSPAVGNPFLTVPGYEAYYAYGIRNCYGLDFDPITNVLWQSENGPANYDEINRVDGGFNSGWKQIMGPDARDPQGVGDLVMVTNAFYSDPEFSWFDSRGVTAIEFLDSTGLGVSYENDLFAADFTSGNLYHFELNASRDSLVFSGTGLQDLVADTSLEVDALVLGSFDSITDLDTGPDGNLYVLDRPPPGTVYRIRHVVRDLATSNDDLSVVCMDHQEAEVSGTYKVYGAGGGVVVPSVTVSFYLDVVDPANLLQSYEDTNLVDGEEITKVFPVALPTNNPHDIIMVVDESDVVLEDRETNNQAEQSIACSATATPAVRSPALILEPNVPNPFGAGTTIRYRLDHAGHVEVDVFDVRGRRVKRLLSRVESAGWHAIFWDGRNQTGDGVAAGIYRMRVRFGGEVGVRSVVLGR